MDRWVGCPPTGFTGLGVDRGSHSLTTAEQLVFLGESGIAVPLLLPLGVPPPKTLTTTSDVGNVIPPPLYKLQPCPSYSGRRGCINLGSNLIMYQR